MGFDLRLALWFSWSSSLRICCLFCFCGLGPGHWFNRSHHWTAQSASQSHSFLYLLLYLHYSLLFPFLHDQNSVCWMHTLLIFNCAFKMYIVILNERHVTPSITTLYLFLLSLCVQAGFHVTSALRDLLEQWNIYRSDRRGGTWVTKYGLLVGQFVVHGYIFLCYKFSYMKPLPVS